MSETVAQGVAYEVNSGSFVTASVSGSIVESIAESQSRGFLEFLLKTLAGTNLTAFHFASSQ